MDREVGGPFIVFSLPRSRSYWLSKFLSRGEYQCAHDQMRFMRGMDDVRSWLAQDFTGAAEPSAALWWRTVRLIRPDIRVLVVRRPVQEVVESLMQLDMRGICNFDQARLTRMLQRLDRALDRIEDRWLHSRSVRYEDLATEAACARVFEHCLPYKHEPKWWAAMSPINLQCDMRATMRYMLGHRSQIDRTIAVCARETRALLVSKSVYDRADLADVTFQAEPFAAFWRDGQALFAQHAAEAGPREGVMLNLNVPLAEAMERNGGVQIVTARVDGRMVGYLVTLIGPSFEDASLICATQYPIFVEKAYRGIGWRLQKASIDMLAERGVGEAVLRAGVRGSGPRLDAFYKRLGASEYGRLYSLMLRKAA